MPWLPGHEPTTTEYREHNGVHVSPTIGDLDLAKALGICARCVCALQPPASAVHSGLESWLECREGHPGLSTLIWEADTYDLGSNGGAMSNNGDTSEDNCQGYDLQSQLERKREIYI